ncbi:helix-turn-helix transcriptional regulator [Chlorogloea sp. CCALA 695]|uniref:helix-turn-helix transcriptional regulator n=1 Tax=Chlorogloea sp. CCALA 695 TaxID=2107693 RepID=UPI000D068C88|nr:LuxR C-terminal-related transcriptional regulator [Chlorogloea sp. CCALA 695]PSB33531.1 helix-turn-helix transcriptional regulator [Chlorogloea sp. CCALA 695]
MTILQPLFQTIALCKDEQQLRSHVVETGGDYFKAKRCGVFFFDRINIPKVMRLALSVEYNPVARYLVERHAPVHDGLLTSPKTWRLICPRADHWHVMAGPIVSSGQLVGTVGFTREQVMPAFDDQNLADLSALCLHLSTWTATMRSQPVQKLESEVLTPREVQIAQLVAQGRTNSEIGVELWITENSVKQALKRMFRKLEVSSRAEMTAQFVVATMRSPNSIEV